MRYVLEHVGRFHRDSALLYLEDDVTPYPVLRDVRKYIRPDIELRRRAFVSYCDLYLFPEAHPYGIYEVSPEGPERRGWWGAQALLLHPDFIQFANQSDWFSPTSRRTRRC